MTSDGEDMRGVCGPVSAIRPPGCGRRPESALGLLALVFAVLLPVLCLVSPSTAVAERPVQQRGASPDPEDLRYVYATEKEALQEIFPDAAVFVLELRPLGESVRRELSRRLRRPVREKRLYAYLAYDDAERFLGYGVVTEEIGKYRPITFMVGIAPDLVVREVQVLVYRESRGMEVRRKRFLHQYAGKEAEDPIRINRDIVNVTGATLSVRAVNAGVRRVLASVEEVYGKDPPTLAEAEARLEPDDPGSPP